MAPACFAASHKEEKRIFAGTGIALVIGADEMGAPAHVSFPFRAIFLKYILVSAVDSIRGMLKDVPSDIDLDSLREERLSKYENHV